MIKRKWYEQQIQNIKGKPFIKVLIGQRRVGKSTLLRSIIEHFDTYLFIDKEQKIFDHLYNADTLYTYLKKQKLEQFQLLAIDEIQNIAGWEKAILSIFSEYPHLEIWITGSNSAMLSSELTTHLRGRYLSITVYPFLYSEYCLYTNKKIGFESMISYLEDGTMPSLYPLVDMPNAHQWKKDLVNTIVLKDIVERYAIRDVDFLYDLYLFLLNNIGNITSQSSLINYIKSIGKSISPTTLQQYITYLGDAFLIYECPLYDIQGKRIFERQRKYYVNDAAMRKVYFGGYDGFIGKNIENLTYLTAKTYGWQVFVGRIGDIEVDFICERAGKKIYLQVTYLLADQELIKREYQSLKEITDARPRYIISMDQIPLGTKEGIQHIPLWEIEKILQ